ncbi:social gliding motility protein Tgl [Plesiocystis pacifica SIR-1]|uniref:Social gliding motility protein Tgl n=1 Tax=Plesiocystis pacifica SIR-1 TaxID=391625 RepID=A6G170_9BACT|nr:tetratricopeptide repeat protein [Plesiocystis pacifica]EDM80365.1 social gliding motility protein Tgl [Plesiocystis pacifica SIR-1]
MHRRIVVLATALCLSTLACAHDRVSPEEQLETATDHYEIALGSAQNGAYDDAKKHIEMALDAVPTHGDSLYLLGLLQLHEGRTIVEFIESEMCLTDEAALAQRERADDLHRQAHESFDLATQAYTEDDPGLGRAYNSMAVVSLYFHDYERAKGELEHALDTQFYTEKYSALANLGWAYYEAGDLVAAMTELRQAVLINPDYCVGRYRLAQVYLDYDMTEAALEQAMTVVNDDRCPIQDVHRVAGIAQMRMGHSDAAGQSFRACLDLAPRSCLADACREFQTVAAAGAQTTSRAGSP